ncbi:hypothetical protein C2S51_022725 [Perilla frutescens var. frutescens]|nr:hypothetical protein C2S51_022725 [Perilla frutescens var. frutescens]
MRCFELSKSDEGRTFTSMELELSNLRVFTFAQLKTTTKNFSRALMLGEDGFGPVYKGVLRDTEGSSKRIDIVFKELGGKELQAGHGEWVTEVNVLGIVDHPYLEI